MADIGNHLVCHPDFMDGCDGDYPHCLGRVYVWDGISMPCPTLKDYLDIWGPFDAGLLRAMAYEIGVQYHDMQNLHDRLYYVQRNPPVLIVERNS